MNVRNPIANEYGDNNPFELEILSTFKGGSRGWDRGSGLPLEFWQKSGYQIRDWDRFDIAQHLCKLQS